MDSRIKSWDDDRGNGSAKHQPSRLAPPSPPSSYQGSTLVSMPERRRNAPAPPDKASRAGIKNGASDTFSADKQLFLLDIRKQFELFSADFILQRPAALIIGSIALTGTGSGPGIREGGGSLPLWCSGSHRHVRARNRPAAPGHWVRDSVSEKRMLGSRQHRGSRGEAARSSSSARQRPPPNWVQPGRRGGPSDRPTAGQRPTGRVERAT